MGEKQLDCKSCSVCRELKPLEQYYSSQKYSKKRGEYIYYNPECKDCTKKAATKWRKENPHKYKQITKNTNKRPERKLAFKEKSRMERNNGLYLAWQRNNKDKNKKYNEQHRNHDITNREWQSCKLYFSNSCAYCGMTDDEHKKIYKQQLHKEHVIHTGRNDLKNCVPSCKECNSEKHTITLNGWYNKNNYKYTYEKYLKIYKWLRYDCCKFIEKKKPKRKYKKRTK